MEVQSVHLIGMKNDRDHRVLITEGKRKRRRCLTWMVPVGRLQLGQSERGSEMDSFAYTRNYDNIALFDKHTRRFTFILGDGGIYSYDAIKKARKSLEYVGTPLENAFANIGRIGLGNAFSSGSEKVQVRVKLFFTDGTFTYGYVSKETVQKGSLQYHKEIVKAEKVVKVLNTIARKNRKRMPIKFSNQNRRIK